jgi:hypothetical protein
MNNIPIEMRIEILSFMNISEYLNMILTCKDWRINNKFALYGKIFTAFVDIYPLIIPIRPVQWMYYCHRKIDTMIQPRIPLFFKDVDIQYVRSTELLLRELKTRKDIPKFFEVYNRKGDKTYDHKVFNNGIRKFKHKIRTNKCINQENTYLLINRLQNE